MVACFYKMVAQVFIKWWLKYLKNGGSSILKSGALVFIKCCLIFFNCILCLIQPDAVLVMLMPLAALNAEQMPDWFILKTSRGL